MLATYGAFTMQNPQSISQAVTRNSTPSARPSPTPIPLPNKKVLQNNYHIFQSFNNCGPASLSMTLSYYGINESQETLGQALRPYQNPQGDNDDKSVTLAELAEKAKDYGLLSYHRPNGNIDLIKHFIALELPVLTRTWLKHNEDIGHYRVVKGYDDTTQTIIQDDSLQGKNLSYSYEEFMQLWKKFNYEYVVLVPKEKKSEVEKLLGDNLDEQTAWKHALEHAEKESEQYPDDIYARFNVSVASYHTGDYAKSIRAYEQVATALPFRTLWYQIEPILSYYHRSEDEKLFALTENILTNQNRAFSELYLLRGKIYQRRNQDELAKQEFEKAIFYNSNLTEANKALSSLSL